MPADRSTHDQGVRFLRVQKIVVLADLIVHLRCSRRTVQRRLVQWRAIHSYNQNGRYYTLPDIPQFDAHGLWRHRGVFFSRYGNLSQTFVQLVYQSESGLTAAEVGDLLGLKPGSFLWAFRNHPALKRERHHGRYVYLSSEPARYAEQRRHRARLSPRDRRPTEAEAIAILVEKIKHPASSAEQLSRRLRRKTLDIPPERIRQLLAQHGLAVKKTPPSI